MVSEGIHGRLTATAWLATERPNMTQHDDFYREYFIQLRRECDAIRCEMNRFLYFALVILGAIGFSVVQGEEAERFFQRPSALLTEIAALVAITSLFWLRRLHMQQLADRWYILRDIARRHFNDGSVDVLHEDVACGRIEATKGKAYLRQEWILNSALTFPVYVPITLTCLAQTDFSVPARLLTCSLIIAVHFAASYCLLYSCATLRDPLKRK
jgi:hypothetical protein